METADSKKGEELKMNKSKRKKYSFLIIFAIFVLAFGSTYAEKKWIYGNGHLVSNTFCFDIPSAFQELATKGDSVFAFQTEKGDMVFKLEIDQMQDITLDAIASKLSVEDSTFFASIYSNAQNNALKSKLVARGSYSLEKIEYIEYKFDVDLSGNPYTGYFCMMNIRDTANYCLLIFAYPNTRANMGKLYYTKVIDSVNIYNEKTMGTPEDIIASGHEAESTQQITPEPTTTPKPTPEPTATPAPTPEPDYDRSITISYDNLKFRAGEKEKITATITKLKEDAPNKTDLVWAVGAENIATVNKTGVVTGVSEGTTEIICYAKDNPDIRSSVTVTILKPLISKIQPLNAKTVITSDYVSIKEIIKVTPEGADLRKLDVTSSDKKVIKTSGTDLVVTGPGDCVLTIEATDGSKKSAKIKVHVPAFYVDQHEYKVTSKNGLLIPVHWNSSETLTLQSKSNAFSANWKDNMVFIDPIKAGTGTITITCKNYPKDKVNIKITIDKESVYDAKTYEKISYKSAARRPDSFKKSKVQFQGRVLQVVNDTSFRISSKGNWDDVVYVTIPKNKLNIPLVEDDDVIVYGAYDGNYAYTTIFGASVTIPKVAAEKITVK